MQNNFTYASQGHQRHLRVGRNSEPLACYAITKCVVGRRPILAKEAPAKIICDCFDWLRQQNQIKLLAFCIMPDHYHALFVLLKIKSLTQVMSSIGMSSGKQINKLIGGSETFWQEGFHDHQCRDNDDVHERLTYIEFNPVRAGFVAEPAEWPYSSAYPANRSLLDRQWYAERL
jgi:putative transposase